MDANYREFRKVLPILPIRVNSRNSRQPSPVVPIAKIPLRFIELSGHFEGQTFTMSFGAMEVRGCHPRQNVPSSSFHSSPDSFPAVFLAMTRRSARSRFDSHHETE